MQPTIPAYDLSLPNNWLPTAWEPPQEALHVLLQRMAQGERPTAELQAWLQQYPASSDGFNALGIAHALAQQWPHAMRALDAAVALTNQYHHYVHYIGSAIHTCRAEWARALGDEGAVLPALEKALFQDHTNPRALALKAGTQAADAPMYQLAIWQDDQWPPAIRLPAGATHAEDAWNSAPWLCRDGAPVRQGMLQAVMRWHHGEKAEARAVLEEVAALAHRWHMHYHRQASIHRLQRGRVWEALAEPLLARDEYRHAHDIDPSFAAPLEHRAALNAQLGNAREAEADRAKLETLK